MRKPLLLPRWPSIVLVIGVLCFTRTDCFDRIFGSNWFIAFVLCRVAELIGLALVWIEYVVNTGSITSTLRDKLDEALFRLIGWAFLTAPIIAILVALLLNVLSE